MSPVAIKLIIALIVVATVAINPIITAVLVSALVAYHFFAGVSVTGKDPVTGEDKTITIHSPSMAVHHTKEITKDAVVLVSGAIGVATAKANQYNTLENRKMEHIGFSLKEDAAKKAAARAENSAQWAAKVITIDAETQAKLDDLNTFFASVIADAK